MVRFSWLEMLKVSLVIGLISPPQLFSDEFKFKPGLDYPMLALSIVGGLGSNLVISRLKDRPSSEWMDYNFNLLDEPFKGTYSSLSATSSDYLSFLAVTPFLISGYEYINNQKKSPIIMDLVMFFEAISLSSSLNLFTRASILKARPLMFSKRAKQEDRKPEALHSFYSGHTSAAFMTATYTSYTFQTRYPENRWIYWIWPISLSTAGLIGGLRIAAGKHYPTDVLVGAMIGSLTGFLIPWSHKIREPKGITLHFGLNFAEFAVNW